MKSKYYEIGFQTGYDIASENINELTQDNQDEFMSNMAEHESDVYRQFSPFEFLAKEMNRGKKSGEKWNSYDEGVTAGIQKAIDDRLEELEAGQDEA